MKYLKPILLGLAACAIAYFAFDLYKSTRNGKLQTGQLAPEIVLQVSADSVFKLSSLKGKMVLIDFWASWCAPCRNSNPTLLELYREHNTNDNKIAGTGLEVVMVSLDDKRSAWLRAIEKDSIGALTHVIDTMAWKSKAAMDYGINSIPATFLINEGGYVVGKNLTKREAQLLIKKSRN